MADASSYDPNGESDYQVTLDRAGTRPAQHPTRPEIRLLDPEFYVDPEPHFAWMREEAPVWRAPEWQHRQREGAPVRSVPAGPAA